MTDAIIRDGDVDPTFEVLLRIGNERIRQDRKWGVQDHDLPTWVAILGEEFGEFAQEVLNDKFGQKDHSQRLLDEVIQVGAVAAVIAEYLIRHRGDYIADDVVVPCPHCGAELFDQVVLEDGYPKCGVCWKVVSVHQPSDITSSISMPDYPAPEMPIMDNDDHKPAVDVEWDHPISASYHS